MVVPSTLAKANTLRLIEQSDNIKRRIDECGQILARNNVGMNDSLIDAEGYPRNDIDVYQVRNARHQIINLQNDLKNLMDKIKEGLEEVHANAAAESSSFINLNNAEESENLVPFAKVNTVFEGSPAEDAGLKNGDEIITFGSCNSKNFTDLQNLTAIARHQINQKIPLKIKRGNNIIKLSLIPKNWSGNGILGCFINLIDVVDR